MKKDFGQMAKRIGNQLGKYSSDILIGFGISGMISSTVFAVKSTPKALSLIDKKKEELEKDKLTTKETIAASWKCYIPSAVFTLASASCIIGAQAINSKEKAMLLTAYSMSGEAFKRYKEKVKEVVGDKKEKEIVDSVAIDTVERTPKNNIINTGRGTTLCLESLSGRYFYSDIEYLRKAENLVNRRLIEGSVVTLNDLYYEMGLDEIRLGDSLGWDLGDSWDSISGLISLSFTSCLTKDETPCLVVGYDHDPRYMV